MTIKREIVCRVISEKDGGEHCGLSESNMKSLTDFITQEINDLVVKKILEDFIKETPGIDLARRMIKESERSRWQNT